jgi:predicted ferric reductase
MILPVIVAAGSEFLQYRSATYVVAGFAGVIGLSILLLQPLLASGLLPFLPMGVGRRVHRWTGAALLLAIAVHVIGLWITSPPDMIDALTFTAPTAFSAFGVIAMWALVAAALLAGFRRKLRLRPQLWRLAHVTWASVVAIGSVAHAILIEGTMGSASKILICAVVLGALALTVYRLHPWKGVWRRHEGQKPR